MVLKFLDIDIPFDREYHLPTSYLKVIFVSAGTGRQLAEFSGRSETGKAAGATADLGTPSVSADRR